ncbi:MAG: hypothetical protein C4525_04570 [Desulfarculus sp.]|jgi:predicted transcriptional regulator|nr:MAG: hypothetical protein C4525_04570 [Desulfarculus sp.]
MSVCESCKATVEPEDIHEFAGKILCDDCYMDALNPARACDPWAVYTASRLPEQTLNPAQEKIMALIHDQGRALPAELMQAAGLDEAGLKRELAALRHMELVRGEKLPDGRVAIRRFND